ncbi:MAG: protein kinase domain-containing protein [bacterium]
MIGQRLNHYRIVAELGRGGMGQVYLAEDTRLKRQVALKTLPPEMASDPDRRARFEREARMVAALNHPNIVTIYSVEECDGTSFITMELVEGKPLTDLIPKDGLPLSRLLEIAVPLADAIAVAHRKGITHRDLKPANVMVTGEGRVKVLDFGLAKLTDVEPAGPAATQGETATMAATTEGKIVGTVAYMSPEQAAGKPVDARSDVFSLGIVLYEMATGRRPFEGDSAASTIAAILRDTPRDVGELKPGLSRDLGRIVGRCLAKAPDRRYQTALDIRNELDGLKTEIESGKQGVPAPGVVVERPTRRRAWLVPGLVAMALLVAAGAVMLWPKLRSSSAPGAPGSATAEGVKSIAVLPFANMSGNPDNEYFSDGLAEELLSVLAKVQGLRVAARTSSFHFKGHTGDIAEVGKQLKVATILEGSVRRAGDKVRVTAQLINAADGFHLWSETYDRQLDDVFAIQADIASQVVGALKVTLLGGEAERLAKRPTENLEAYDAYLLGQQRIGRRRSDSIVESMEYFQKAIDLDPDFALAYVGLANAIVLQTDYFGFGALDPKDALSRGEALINKTLALDSQLGEAYATLGSIRMASANLEEAEQAFRRAIELNPSYAPTYVLYSELASWQDEDRALDLARKAFELDPLSPSANNSLASALKRKKNFDEALVRFRHAIEIDPGFVRAYSGIADIYTNDLEQPEEGAKWLEKAIELDPRNPRSRDDLAAIYQSLGRIDDAIGVWLRMIEVDPALAQADFVSNGLVAVYLHAGRFEDAEATIRKAIDDHPRSPQPYGNLAKLYLTLGRVDEAVRSCHEALERDDTWMYGPYFLGELYLSLDDEPLAHKWWDRFLAAAPGNPFAWQLELGLHLRRSELAEAEAVVRKWQDAPQFPLGLIWLFDMRAGRYEDARKRYEAEFPGLTKDLPKIDANDLEPAIHVAASLLKSGERPRAEQLLRQCEAFLDAQPGGVRVANFQTHPMYVYALQGRKEDALAALRRAVEEQHWRGEWWSLQLDPTLESVAGDPRFEALIAQVREDLARQRKRLASEGLATK